MVRHIERGEAVSFDAALLSLGAAPGTDAVALPAELDLGALGLGAAGKSEPARLALIDAEQTDAAEALRALAPRLAGGALVAVRARVRGEGALGRLRGKRDLESVVEPLLSLPLAALGVIEVRGLRGVTIAWARLKPDAPLWIDA